MNSRRIWNAILELWMLSFTAALQTTSELHFCGSQGADPIMNHDQIEYTRYSTQAIVPEMRFNFSGYITGWSAQTRIITLQNYVETLTHAITFQVWRPSSPTDPLGYTLVGSNSLTFERDEIKPGLTDNPFSKNTSYFIFTNKQVPMEKQIRFLPGDVIGWYVLRNVTTATIPLSVLYKARSHDTGCAIHEYSTDLQKCSLCTGQKSTIVASASPHISIHYVKNEVQESCSVSVEKCDTSLRHDTSYSENVTESGSAAPNTGQRSDCQQAVVLGVVILVSVGLIFIIQVVVCATCIFMLVRLQRQGSVTLSPDTPTIMPLRIIPALDDNDETKIQDLIGHNDNQTYEPANSNNNDTSSKTAPATYEEIPRKK